MAWLSPHLCPTITLLISYLCFWQGKLKPSFCVILPSFSPLTWTWHYDSWERGDDVSSSLSFWVPSFQFPLVFHPSLVTFFGSWWKVASMIGWMSYIRGLTLNHWNPRSHFLKWISEQHGDFQCLAPEILVWGAKTSHIWNLHGAFCLCVFSFELTSFSSAYLENPLGHIFEVEICVSQPSGLPVFPKTVA